MRINGQDFVTGFEEKEREGIISEVPTWETMTLSTERGNTGVTAFYGGENRFGF